MNRLRHLLYASLFLALVATPASAQLVSRWAGENNTNDSVGENDASGTVGYRSGHIGQGFDFNGAQSLSVPGAIAGGLGSTSGFSIFVYAGQDTFAGGEEIVSLLGNGDSGFSLEAHPSTEGMLRFRVNTSGNTTFAVLDASSFSVPSGHLLTATYDGATDTMRVYHEATMVAEKTNAGGSGMVLDGDEAFVIGDGWDGLIDQLAYYDRALTPGEVAALFGGSDLIFGDGFESGNMSSWSDSVP